MFSLKCRDICLKVGFEFMIIVWQSTKKNFGEVLQ